MKVVNETFTDEEFAFLKELKDGLSWRKFILDMAKDYKKREEN